MWEQWKVLRKTWASSALDEVGVEFNNVLNAWNYAIGKRWTANLKRMEHTLVTFCDFRIPDLEAADLFRRAVEALQSLPPEKETEILLGLMMAHQGWFTNCVPKFELHAKVLITKGLAILRKYDCPKETLR